MYRWESMPIQQEPDAAAARDAQHLAGGEAELYEQTLLAHAANPMCERCGRAVEHVIDAALLVGTRRVVHIRGCFVASLMAAVKRVGGLRA